MLTRARLLLLTVALAALGSALAGSPTHAANERFDVRITSIRAVVTRDSITPDEVYLLTRDIAGGSYGQGRTRTSMYEGIDPGETRTIKAHENCVTRTNAIVDSNGDGVLNGSQGDRWECSRTSAPILTFQLELMSGDPGPDTGIGFTNVSYTRNELVALMPSVGSKHVRTLTLCFKVLGDVTDPAEFQNCVVSHYKVVLEITRTF
jgi:hypothetical protein